MKRSLRQWVYGVSLAGLLALGTGLATGAISFSSNPQNANGSAVSYNGTVTGLKFTSVVAGAVPNPAPVASIGTAALPQSLGSGANVFCAKTCTAGHLALNVTYTFNSSMANAIQITITLTAASGGGTTVLYLRQALLPTSGTIVAVWDIGTTSSELTFVTASIHQCGLLTCP